MARWNRRLHGRFAGQKRSGRRRVQAGRADSNSALLPLEVKRLRRMPATFHDKHQHPVRSYAESLYFVNAVAGRRHDQDLVVPASFGFEGLSRTDTGILLPVNRKTVFGALARIVVAEVARDV